MSEEGRVVVPAASHTAFPAGVLPDGELFLSPQDLARRWGVSLHTIRDLRKRGRLPQPVPFPFRNLRWAKADIEAYEASLRGKTARRAVQYQQVSRHTGRDDE